ncbi:chitosanase [Streptomyces sp. NPDC048434]|uniref:chitosanase n=1 Tax=Streptomyces sp. NPDC048434 TaxID=3365549 RepID=UPI00371C390D
MRTRSIGSALPRTTTRVALGLALLAVPATAVATTAGPAAPHRPATAQHAPHTARAATGLDDPAKKEIAMQLVSSAENSSLDWKAQYQYIEDIGDGRGYTGGIIGFCSGTHDMLELVELYTQRKPGNALAKYLPALRDVDGSDSHDGLDPGYTKDWKKAAQDPAFQQAQNDERDRVYFNPAVKQGKADGIGVLGQFTYYDAIVMHGDGDDATSFSGIRKRALAKAKPPAQGGDEKTYLNAFLDARVWAMKQEEAHSDTSRVDSAQRVFLQKGNLDLHTPLDWKVYGDSYHIG